MIGLVRIGAGCQQQLHDASTWRCWTATISARLTQPVGRVDLGAEIQQTVDRIRRNRCGQP